MNLRKTKEHKQASNPWNCEIYFNEQLARSNFTIFGWWDKLKDSKGIAGKEADPCQLNSESHFQN